MSLSIYLIEPNLCPHCGGKLRDGLEHFESNYTHNVTPMWQKAGVYDALYMSDGHLAKEYLDVLRLGVKHMREHPADYEGLNPPNGWGSYRTALLWLGAILRAFEANPDLTIVVSK